MSAMELKEGSSTPMDGEALCTKLVPVDAARDLVVVDVPGCRQAKEV
jgi:hypothetical protein